VAASGLLGGARGARRVDCGGAVLYPGFVDAHCHPLALGSALTAADCRPATCRSIADIQRAVRSWASEHPAERWVRAFGYDELRLAERRHPTRRDLDAAVSDRPVQLVHGSGHAIVLNSAALRAAGITEATDEPPGAFIDREPDTGTPNGVLFEMAGFVARRVDETGSDPTSVRRFAAAASEAFLRAGITSVTDASPSNDLSTMRLWADLRSGGAFRPRITVMRAPGVHVPPEALVELERHIQIGPVKVVLTCYGGRLHPEVPVLDRIVADAVASGAGIAVHAVESAAVLAACSVFERWWQLESTVVASTGASAPGPASLRIEHAAETPAEVCSAIRRSGAIVVTQPGFVVARGDRYLQAARSGGCDPDNLYAVRRLLDAGVPVRASSDAPYGPVSPVIAVYGAVARTSASGAPVGLGQAISASQGLAMYHPAWPDLAHGATADLVLLSDDPQDVAYERLPGIEVLATVVGGEVAWEAAGLGLPA
jgi:predicted amidohydrolase YtcJ